MKAIVWTKYGPPESLEPKDVPKPAPKEHEILVRIHATTVTAGDCEMRSLKFPPWLALPIRLYAGIRKPERITIIGQEMAGEVETIGSQVKRYKPGDQVFASTGFGHGTYCEYVCLPEVPGDADGALAIKPAGLTYEQAAALPVGGLEALHFLRQANLQAGQKILINGAGGSIGTAAIQLARHYGTEVTAVDSAAKLDMLLSIGAEQVIDYTREDFTQRGETYDVIFDVVGKSSISGSLGSLKEDGIYLVANPRLSLTLHGAWASMTGSKKIVYGGASYKPEDLDFLGELVEAGKLRVIIDRTYPLEQMAEAHRYVESGQKKGNVVITVG